MQTSGVLNELLTTLGQLSGPAAYCTIVGVLLICGFGVPIPEDITLIAAGLLASSKSISLTGAFIAGFGGVMLGDSILFFLGRKYGKRVFTMPGLRRFMTPERVASAEARIRRNGPFICFIARFLPGLRAPIFAMSGALGVKRSTFFLLDGFAALISVPLWIYLGFWFGENLDEALSVAKRIQVWIFIGVAALIAGYVVVRFVQRKKSVAPGVTQFEERKGIGDSHP